MLLVCRNLSFVATFLCWFAQNESHDAVFLNESVKNPTIRWQICSQNSKCKPNNSRGAAHGPAGIQKGQTRRGEPLESRKIGAQSRFSLTMPWPATFSDVQRRFRPASPATFSDVPATFQRRPATSSDVQRRSATLSDVFLCCLGWVCRGKRDFVADALPNAPDLRNSSVDCLVFDSFMSSSTSRGSFQAKQHRNSAKNDRSGQNIDTSVLQSAFFLQKHNKLMENLGKTPQKKKTNGVFDATGPHRVRIRLANKKLQQIGQYFVCLLEVLEFITKLDQPQQEHWNSNRRIRWRGHKRTQNARLVRSFSLQFTSIPLPQDRILQNVRIKANVANRISLCSSCERLNTPKCHHTMCCQSTIFICVLSLQTLDSMEFQHPSQHCCTRSQVYLIGESSGHLLVSFYGEARPFRQRHQNHQLQPKWHFCFQFLRDCHDNMRPCQIWHTMRCSDSTRFAGQQHAFVTSGGTCSHPRKKLRHARIWEIVVRAVVFWDHGATWSNFRQGPTGRSCKPIF